MLVTHPNSPIHNLDDLKGKTVGTIVGSDLHFVPAGYMLQATFGSADPAKNNIQLVNSNNAGQIASVPQGMDAALTLTTFLLAQKQAGTVAVLNWYGSTESDYKGPLGSGWDSFCPRRKNHRSGPRIL